MHVTLVADLTALLLCVVESHAIVLDARGRVDRASWGRIPVALRASLVSPDDRCALDASRRAAREEQEKERARASTSRASAMDLERSAGSGGGQVGGADGVVLLEATSPCGLIVLDHFLAASDFLCGAGPCAADAALRACFAASATDLAPFARTRAWVERVDAVPAADRAAWRGAAHCAVVRW